jgi:hypothetical protein
MGRSKIYRLNKMLRSIKVKRTGRLNNQQSILINRTGLKKINNMTKSKTMWTKSLIMRTIIIIRAVPMIATNNPLLTMANGPLKSPMPNTMA